MIRSPDVIIVIGNGFDLNLGLKTSYSDFINSEHFKKIVDKNDLFWHLIQCHGLQKWIDIENELKEYAKNKATDKFEIHFNELCENLSNYLNNINYESINRSSNAFKLIQNIKDSNFLIIDFNYTNTIAIILKELGLDEDSISERHIKIHGSAKEGNIIFGVEDQARIDRQHIFLKKAFNIYFIPININKLLSDSDQVIFFGHSLGETDHMYFKQFFSEITISYTKPKEIDLYFHGSSGYSQMFMQLDELTMFQLSSFKQRNIFKAIDASTENNYFMNVNKTEMPGIFFSNPNSR